MKVRLLILNGIYNYTKIMDITDLCVPHRVTMFITVTTCIFLLSSDVEGLSPDSEGEDEDVREERMRILNTEQDILQQSDKLIFRWNV